MDQELLSGANGLTQALAQENLLTDQLKKTAQAKKAALASDGIEALQAELEHEEELIGRFREQEEAREKCTRILMRKLRVDDGKVTLRQLAEKIPDSTLRERLEKLGAALSSSVKELRELNDSVRRILILKNDHVDMMLRILSGNEEDVPTNYDSHGSVSSEVVENHGIYEVMV